MTEGGEDPRLALEAPQAARIAAERLGEALDRDLAAEAGVERTIDAPHAAGAEQIEDLIAADVLSEHQAIAGGFVRRRGTTAAAAARLARLGRREIRAFRRRAAARGFRLRASQHGPPLVAEA